MKKALLLARVVVSATIPSEAVLCRGFHSFTSLGGNGESFTSFIPPVKTSLCRRRINDVYVAHNVRLSMPSLQSTTTEDETSKYAVEEVDVAIVGAGIGGLCAGAILSTLYGKKVGVYESHYLPGGCAHAFERSVKLGCDDDPKTKPTTFTFDSGPTIVLGCSKKPYNPLQQVLRAVGVDSDVEWISYDGWGMIEHPPDATGDIINDLKRPETRRWKLQVGPGYFEEGPLQTFSPNSTKALEEFNKLREITAPLVSGAATIPAMAMRPGNAALVPLLRYLPALFQIISNGVEASTGSFAPYMDGPIFTVTDPWLRDWLDALAFSLSGLPASRTSAGALAYVLFDMHREGAALDYPKGGLGSVVNALVKGVEQDIHLKGSRVNLRSHVESIDTNEKGNRVIGLTIRCGGDRKGKIKVVRVNDGVICNAPIWSLRKLIKNATALQRLSGNIPSTGLIAPAQAPPSQSWITALDANSSSGRGSVLRTIRERKEEFEKSDFLSSCDSAEMTGSFLHLHVALNATGIELDSLLPHYTVMDRGLEGDEKVFCGVSDGACGELNMIAVSNPCVLDRALAPEGYIVVHAYGAGNEPYGIWRPSCNEADSHNNGEDASADDDVSAGRYSSPTYEALKNARVKPLWRAIESIIPDARDRTVLALVGSPLTHERFLRRPYGTYGASVEDCLKDGSTPIQNLVLCGDGVFPGIGIPAVALSGASAANAMVSVWHQWNCLDHLKKKGAID
mmetsp:Transcript_10125/g.21248  ORF Transcript_10125/g.21248 Transcript_10125/m.21248 type:complete len:737 (+) Transcript_10125:223-2433(+)